MSRYQSNVITHPDSTHNWFWITEALSSRGECRAYMSLVIQLIVGEFELIEADHLPHPGVPWGQRIWVDVDPRGNRRVRVSCHHPLGAVVHIPRKHNEKWTVSTGMSGTTAVLSAAEEAGVHLNRLILNAIAKQLLMFFSVCRMSRWDFSCFHFLIMFMFPPWLVFPPHSAVLKTHLRLFGGELGYYKGPFGFEKGLERLWLFHFAGKQTPNTRPRCHNSGC